MGPGSLGWLLRHDLRVAWRDAAAGYARLGRAGGALLAVAALAATHAGAWDVAGRFGAMVDDPARRGDAAAHALPFAAAVLTLLLAQAMIGATKLIYARGDLELVLSSPVSLRRVLAARCLAVALGAFASVAVFALPVADAAAARGHPRLLAVYPALAAAAMLAAACGMAAVSALLRALGPRRTRVAGQILAAGAGGAFILAAQSRRVAPGIGEAWWPAEGAASALLLPARAAVGEPAALLAWAAIGAAALAAAVALLGPAFRRSVEAAEAGEVRRRRAPGRAGRRAFPRGPLPAIRAKELRVIARDPWLLSRVALQVSSVGSLAVLLWSGGRDPALALAPAIAAAAYQLSSSLAWLSLSGEDAPDLLASAPVPAALWRRGKGEAVGGLVLAVVGIPLAWLASVAPATAAAVSGLALAGLGAALAVQGWHAAPGRRSRFAARHRESKLMSLVEVGLSVLLGLSGFLAALPSVWALAPLGLAGGLVFSLRPRQGGSRR